jgi:release factor glutamine methyltransferase
MNAPPEPPGPQPLTVGAALRQAVARGLARLDAELLMAAALGRPRTWVLTHPDEPLGAIPCAAWQALVARRLDDVPLAYLTGGHEFHGLLLEVTPDVLDPRPDTETLVDWALALGPAGAAEVLDLGTGSGAIALALKARRPDWSVTATDRSAAALAVARRNGERLGLAAHWVCGPWWQAVPGRRFDLAVSNPPYIALGDAHLHALRHEPTEALVAGFQGLDDLALLIDGAPRHLVSGGWLLLEHGHDQAPAVRERLGARGFQGVLSRRDLAGIERCSAGRWPG